MTKHNIIKSQIKQKQYHTTDYLLIMSLLYSWVPNKRPLVNFWIFFQPNRTLWGILLSFNFWNFFQLSREMSPLYRPLCSARLKLPKFCMILLFESFPTWLFEMIESCFEMAIHQSLLFVFYYLFDTCLQLFTEFVFGIFFLVDLWLFIHVIKKDPTA